MELKMVVPKGRQKDKVTQLMADAGIQLFGGERDYRPRASDPELKVKLLKSQNIPPMVDQGLHDIGFAGADWITEQKAEVETILDLGFDPVRIVASVPEDWDWEAMKKRGLIAVSEYRNLTSNFLESEGVDYTFIRSYGATEVFPPEDADLVVDNTATGATLKANRLKIVATLMQSTTRFIADRRAMDVPAKRDKIEAMALLFRGVLAGRTRVLLEMNVADDRLEDLVSLLPAMKAPTVSKLYKQAGFSVKAAVPKAQVAELIPRLKTAGAVDILETPIRKVIP